MPLRAVTGPVFDSFLNVFFRMAPGKMRGAVLVDVSYLAVDALEVTLVKGDNGWRVCNQIEYQVDEGFASKKWDDGKGLEDVPGDVEVPSHG